MGWISRGLVSGIIAVSASVSAMAQSDVCAPGPRDTRSEQERVEAMKIEAAERAEREAGRSNWDVKMFSVKNEISTTNLRALCIFRIEVVPQPTLHLVQVRGRKEIMPEIEDALKKLDVPPTIAKNVELTAYVIVNTDAADPRNSTLPAALQPVVNQLKSLVPDGMWSLADTVVARGTDGQYLNVYGTMDFKVTPQIREIGGTLNVHLNNLSVSSRGAVFNTSIDIPVGTQAVVGKSGSAAYQSGGVSYPAAKAVVLVLTAKILN